jgi:predicted phage tail protein
VKKHILLPLAALLIATSSWAATSAQSSLTISTTALSFNGSSGNVSSQPLTIVATGPITITGVSFSNSAFSAQPVRLPATVSSGQRMTGQIQISARPQSAAQTGKMTIATNAGTFTVSLSETAITKPSATHASSLTWSAPSKSSVPVDSYQVNRAVSGSTQYSVVGTTAAASTAFTDNSVSSGQTYVYAVQSVDESGNTSSPSNTVTLAIP